MIALALYLLLGVAPAQPESWRAALAALPPLPEPAAPLASDWLVRMPTRRAGVFRGARRDVLVLDNGLVRRTFLLAPNAATIGLDRGSDSLLRAVRPEARLVLDGREIAVGGLTGQPVENYLDDAALAALKPLPGSLQFDGFASGPIRERFAWKPRREWLSREPVWPPQGVELVLRFEGDGDLAGLRVDVHCECYDGLPLLAKWFTLTNGTGRALVLDRFESEILALVEAESEVEDPGRARLPNLHVETDATVCAMSGESAQQATVRFEPDPAYATQVSYRLLARCLLTCSPRIGPAVRIEPGASFESFRTWLLPFDSTDAARRTLSFCRMYRTIAPWSQENPLIFHATSAKDDAVRAAIDQAAAVGFEMVILSFGSGVDLETRDAAALDRLASLAAYAHSKHVALGGYSLLASRSVDPATDVIDAATGKPGGARFGASPCLCSDWGRAYFDSLRACFERTGLDVLEHDGSYPGDVCASTAHPGHRGLDDSYWMQREAIVGFYRECRGRGIYLNVPDWYFLNGSSKTGMGYRETNWSLPRAQQEIIERQNIADGTRAKLPSMGWMFVPLSEYHGGGEAATIEPLAQHLDHYQRRLENLLGAGVQACFRGPRLFDGDATRELVVREVAFFRAHRRILESDLLLLRRADGRDWDGWIHVDPMAQGGEERALAMVYNPLPDPIRRRVALPLYYAGLDARARVAIGADPPRLVDLDRGYAATIDVEIPARGALAVVVTAP